MNCDDKFEELMDRHLPKAIAALALIKTDDVPTKTRVRLAAESMDLIWMSLEAWRRERKTSVYPYAASEACDKFRTWDKVEMPEIVE